MCTKKQHQSKWVKTKNDSWRYKNNYFRFWSTFTAETDRFWFVSKIKTALQQLFTKWSLIKVKSEQFDKSLFIGGLHKENFAMCVSFINGLVSVERLLECDQMFFMQIMQ